MMWIEIFRKGSHTDAAGATQDYSAEHLDKMAELYNTRAGGDESFEAPVVKGHPQSDEPALGWVERLARRGDKLVAKLKNVDLDFAREIQRGLFKKISIALYPDGLLRHVGFLGAQSPAIKGLRPVKFIEGADFATFENSFDDRNIVTDKTNRSEDSLEKKMDGKEFSIEEAYEEVLKEKSRLISIISELESKERQKEFREFAGSLIDTPEGAVISPAQSESLVKLLELAYQADKHSFAKEFSEASDYLGLVKSFVSGLKPIFSTKEFAIRPNKNAESSNIGFDEKRTDPERLQLHRQAKEIQALNPKMSYEEAVFAACGDNLM